MIVLQPWQLSANREFQVLVVGSSAVVVPGIIRAPFRSTVERVNKSENLTRDMR